MVKTSDLSILPDSLWVEIFPPAATKVVVGGIMMEGQGDRELVYRGRVLLHMIETTYTVADPKPGQRAVGMGSLRPTLLKKISFMTSRQYTPVQAFSWPLTVSPQDWCWTAGDSQFTLQ